MLKKYAKSSTSCKLLPSGLRSVGFPDYSTLPGSEQLKPLSVPRFPTFFELASQTESPSKKRETGLFEGLLGDPTVLFNDLLDNPGKYEAGVDQVVQRLVSGQASLDDLNEQERQLLDRATLDFSQPRRSEEPLSPKPAPRRDPADDLEPEELGDELGPQEPGDEEDEERKPTTGPQGPMKAFWWV
jgi:hypothetical protein